MIERRLIKGVAGGVDYTEPQSGKQVNEFSYCPKFESRHATGSELPVHENCYYCKYASFNIHVPDYNDMGDCCYPTIKRK